MATALGSPPQLCHLLCRLVERLKSGGSIAAIPIQDPADARAVSREKSAQQNAPDGQPMKRQKLEGMLAQEEEDCKEGSGPQVLGQDHANGHQPSMPDGIRDGTSTYVETPLKKAERRRLDFKGKLYLAPLTTIGNLPFRSVWLQPLVIDSDQDNRVELCDSKGNLEECQNH